MQGMQGMQGIRVNFSEKEAQAESFDQLPAGKYHVKITDVEQQESKSIKNPGKPMLNFRFTVQDGKYSGYSRLYATACLWEGALFEISKILKALGERVNEGNYTISNDPNFYIGRDVDVRVVIERNDRGERNKITGYYPHQAGSISTPNGKTSTSTLLP